MKLVQLIVPSARILAPFCASVALCVTFAQAQGFKADAFYVGPSIGLGFKSALAYGISSEYALTNYLGMGLDGAYYKFTESLASSPSYSASFDQSVVGVFGFGAIHPFSESKYDPFLRIGWGYHSFSSTFTTTASPSLPQPRSSYSSGFIGTIQLGMRYYFSETLSSRVTIGFPVFIGLGIDFRF